MKTTVILFTLFVLFSGNAFAQDYTQWSLPEGAKARLGKGDITSGIAYSPDGTRFAVASSIGIWLYDTQTYQETALFTEHTDTFTDVAFSPDGRTLAASGTASGTWDNVIRVWEVPTGIHKHTLIGLSSGVTSIAFSPNGRTLASGGSGGAHLWNIITGTYKGILTNHSEGVSSLTFSPDGHTLASGGSDAFIRLWDVATGEHQKILHANRGGVTSVAFSPNGKTLASGNDDNTIRLWDVPTGENRGIFQEHTEEITSVAFSTDGKTLSGVSWDGTVHLWDMATKMRKQTLTGHTSGITSITFSPNGTTLASGGYHPNLHLWDVVTGEHKEIFTGHTYGINSIAYSPDGKMLASGGEGRHTTIRLWDVATGSPQRVFRGGTYSVYSIVFSPDGRTLASGGGDKTVRLWEVVTGTQKHILTGHADDVLSVAFSPDGRTLASGGAQKDSIIRLWDVATGSQKRLFTWHTNSVTSIAFSPDGRTLASGSWDGTVRLWDVDTGEHKQELTGHTRSVESVAFSPDGRTLAAGGGGRGAVIRLWDVVTGDPKRMFLGHTERITSVAFSPDGQTLASGSWDGTTLLWQLTPLPNASAIVRVEPSPVQSPTIGTPLTLSLNIVGGENVAGYQPTLQFDPTALRYVESRDRNYFSADAFFITPLVVRNRVTIAATTRAGEGKGGGTLATFTFEVLAVKASNLILFNVLLSDSMGNSLRPRVEGGQVIATPQIFADVNSDNIVNILDLVHVGSNLGRAGLNEADVNGDGVVDIADLVLVAGTLNNEVAAPAAHLLTSTELNPIEVRRWLAQIEGLIVTDATSRRGIRFLERFLAALIPKTTVLLPNYPNPFNPETWIPYHLATASDVTLIIYNTKGEVIRQLYTGYQPAGYYTDQAKAAYWNGRNENGESVASGVYFYQLHTADYTTTRRMVIVK